MAHFREWQNWLVSAATLGVAVGVALLAHHVVFSLAKRLAAKPERVLDASFVRHGRRPAQWIFPLFAVLLVLPLVKLPPQVIYPARHIVGLALLGAIAWVVVVLVDVVADLLESRYRVDVSDNLAARKIQTQIHVLRRIVLVIVTVVTLGIMLMTFPQIHQLGASLLASAGLVGLVVGMAMRPTIASLIAGIQIALTEPIRLEDVVIVNGEWGWIEEIGTTYVVVRIWDLRRMVVPLSYFIEQPFQNWTRNTADLLGSVFVYTDYTVPVEEVRQELRRILQATDKWKGQVCALQVTNATDRTLELRALMDARDSSTAWDLRCYVREKLIEFLQRRYPQSLPRVRAEMAPLPVQTGVV
ncbi:MAG TPA: mechanosensitive ion channel domain-containing protein [Terriglobia bacterium]|nr:mechanosensitive ion channel domain-containing protein [Terriglobia bacterium]